MRELDKNPRELAKLPVQRFHRGPLGRVLERFLQSHVSISSDFSLVALEQLWLAAVKHDPAIGLHLFTQFTPQDWHVLVHLGQYCANVAEANRCWARYASLASDTDQVRIIEESGCMGVELQIDAPPQLARFLAEHYTVMAVTQMRLGTGQPQLQVAAQFRHARPDYHELYKPWFGVDIKFGADRNLLLFDSATQALPMRNRHAGMVEVICQELDRRLARQHQLGGWADKVATSARQALQQGLVPSLESVAESLHQSPRTLRRRLEEQNLSFRQVLDMLRAELEQQYELQGCSRAQIGELLGYNDTAAYLHARKRWS
ncbi:MAG: AraC family transcriptional regulator ligand-binding domain-containing protein [Moraxellaceae bacterium]|nr:AraC family transcriptional regulator ligand-binding domain-containing protein [Moraxellaceae bacterium]MDZ4298450.1 AraC family transcriptional regulator ligand-binding domain-containing protein [Moraxellaceae bacterium]MDZ4387539.1 AraC family transcriptional regulator ligand-binding domain-containing protein [Moraxellaceae bacterium]